MARDADSRNVPSFAILFSPASALEPVGRQSSRPTHHPILFSSVLWYFLLRTLYLLAGLTRSVLEIQIVQL